MLTAKAFYSHPERVTPRREARFFSALRLANRTFKTTNDQRMTELDQSVLEYWRTSGFRPKEALDLGTSSGICTAEWLDAMRNANFNPSMTATDLVLSANLVQLWPGYEVLERSGVVLQHAFLGVAIRPWNRRLDYLSGYVLLNSIANAIALKRLPAVKARAKVTKILLLSQRVLRRADVNWLEADLLVPAPPTLHARFDVVRAANILNREYFGDRELSAAVCNIKSMMAGAGSCLIVNRTWRDGSNNATLFGLSANGRFEAQARFGRGSDIDDLVLSLPAV